LYYKKTWNATKNNVLGTFGGWWGCLDEL
jgi:hypothetical protein